jgi:hypothetical protein
VRLAVSRKLRVGLGDRIVVKATLPQEGALARLYVFARHKGEEFSPYVPHVGDLPVTAEPMMLSPLKLRLQAPQRSVRELEFKSDITGYICVMQEVDRVDEPRARVEVTRTINPHLPWQTRLARWIGIA